MKELDFKKKIITSFLKEKFKNEGTIMIFGSNKELYNKESDIDILIISNHITSFTKEVFEYKNQILDIIIIPEYEINNFIERDKFLKVYIDIFTKGEIIIDKNQLLKEIIKQINEATIPVNTFLIKIQLEKNIIFFRNKILNSKNIYEAEIYLTKIAENIYTRRLLDFGLSNVDSFKHLASKILELDFNLVETLYKIKKKLMQFQNVSIVIEDLDQVVNIKNIWNNNYYSNRLVLSEIYSNTMVVFLKEDKEFEKKMETLLKKELVVFYSFLIDNYNLYNPGKYYVILENKSLIKRKVIPLLEKNFLNNENLILNDSKIIFPFTIDIQLLLGISNKNNFKVTQKLFLMINELKFQHKNEVIFIVTFEILKHIESNINIEKFIYIFTSKSNLLNNNLHLNKSEEYLIDLKNRFYDDKITISNEEIKSFNDIINNVNKNSETANEFEKIKIQLNTICKFIPKDDINKLFNVMNFVFNLLEVKDYQKPYIIILINKIQKNEF